MTSTGVSCFTRSARSRSSSNSGKGSGFCVLGSQPVSALVRNTPGRSSPSSDRGASRACTVRPTWEVGHHEGRGHNLEAEHPLRRRLLHPRPGQRAQALAPQVGGDALQRFGQVGPGASAGVEDVDVLGGQPVLNAQVVLSSGPAPGASAPWDAPLILAEDIPADKLRYVNRTATF